MLLWVIFACMAAGAAILVLRPLTAGGAPAGARADYEAAVYRDQLAGLDAEIDSGALTAAEAAGARAEIARRLLAVGDGAGAADGQGRGFGRAAAIGVAAFIPLASLGLYAGLGSPGVPAAPAASRQAPAGLGNQSIDELIARVEEHLRADPNDARGWEVLGPPLLRLGKFDRAAEAFRRVIALDGPTPARLSALGEALTLGKGGIVEAGARKAFEEAAALEPANPLPQYYLGIAASQDGDGETAVRIWSDLLARSPADAPWRPEIEARIADIAPGAVLPGPDAETVAAAGRMSEAERREMIAGMVERLDTRLADEGGTAEEWLRLVGAFRVLGDDAKRDGAIARARAALAADAEALGRFEAGLGEAGRG